MQRLKSETHDRSMDRTGTARDPPDGHGRRRDGRCHLDELRRSPESDVGTAIDEKLEHLVVVGGG